MANGNERLEEFFSEALEVPEGERSAWLTRICRDRPGLEDRLRALLAAHAKNAADQRVSALPIREPADEVPLAIGHYTVLSTLGTGGGGAVFEARHVETGRRAAVKLLRTGLATGRQKLRFQFEAETLGRLNHPGIAHLYEAGITEVRYAEQGAGGRAERLSVPGEPASRRSFIAMEFVDGEPIGAWADRKKLGVRDRVRLIIEAAHAVEHAHERGVIHRDLKPANVMVTVDGRVKVVDFGIAKLIHDTLQAGTAGVPRSASETASGMITLDGAVAGTPAFMSPEQLSGVADTIDFSTDVYGLGATLYWLLTGRAPLGSTSLLTMAEITRLLATATPHVRSINPAVDADLAAVVHKALERRPQDRYGTAANFVADLERWMAGMPTLARPLGWWTRSIKYVRRNRWKSVAIGMGAAALISLVAGVAGVAKSLQAERTAIDEQQQAMHFMNDMLVRVSPDSTGSLGPDRKLTDLVAAAEREIGRAGVSPRVQASVRLSLARINLGLGRLGPAEADATTALSLLDTMRDDSLLRIQIKELLAQVFAERSRAREVNDLWWEVWQWRVKHQGREHPDTLRAAVELALAELDVNFPHGQLVPPMRKSIEDLERRKTELGPAWTDAFEAALIRVWEIHLHLRIELLDQQVNEQRMLAQAIAAADRLYGSDHPVTVRLERTRGVGLYRRGDFKAASEVLQPVRQRLAARLGEEHTHVLVLDTMLGNILREEGSPGAALALHERTLPKLRANLGDRHYRLVEMSGHIALDLHRLGRSDEAEALLRRSLDDALQVEGPHRWLVRWLNRTLARVLADRGRMDEAAKLLRNALEGHEPTSADINAGGEIASWFLDYAEVHEKLGNLEKARVAAQAGRTSMFTAYGPEAAYSRRAEVIQMRLK